MVVRGAPAIGVAAAYGMALAAVIQRQRFRSPQLLSRIARGGSRSGRRPAHCGKFALGCTAHAVAAKKPVDHVDELRSLVTLANQMADEDVAINRRMSEYGAALIDDGDTIIHHCNTGALAVVDWGTALGRHPHGARTGQAHPCAGR
jgi:methylthioribose-1-phosphate isomerase